MHTSTKRSSLLRRSPRAPLAVYAAKKMINQSYELTLAEALAEEKQTFYSLFASADQKEGMQAFIEKRKTGVERQITCLVTMN